MRKALLFLCLLFTIDVSAQPAQASCSPDDDPEVPCDDGTNPIPLDDYVFYLIGGGALTGILSQRNIQRKIEISAMNDHQQSP
jgi:hypothetical protein